MGAAPFGNHVPGRSAASFLLQGSRKAFANEATPHHGRTDTTIIRGPAQRQGAGSLSLGVGGVGLNLDDSEWSWSGLGACLMRRVTRCDEGRSGCVSTDTVGSRET